MHKTRMCVLKQLPSDFIIPSGPLLTVEHFFIPLQQSFHEPRRSKNHHIPHVQRPDGDNFEKFLNDSLTGVLWLDDSQIVWTVRSKHRTKEKEGSTIVSVYELSSDPPNFEEILKCISESIRF